MATTAHINSAAPSGIKAQLDRFFAGIGQGFNSYMETKSRAAEFEKLNAKSDEELAAMGLRREDIPRHVFRDLLYV